MDQPLEIEQMAFDRIQSEFQRHTFLTHFDPKRQLYINIDASKERRFGAKAYHLKNGDRAKPTTIDPILFLSKCLSPAQTRYWPTELEMARVVWTIQKVHYMVQTAQLPTIIWTDHSAIQNIVSQTKLTSSNVDKLNLRLIRSSMYLSQFNITIRHKAGREHIILDAMSQLPAAHDAVTQLKTAVIAETYTGTVVELSSSFQTKLLESYKTKKWA